MQWRLRARDAAWLDQENYRRCRGRAQRETGPHERSPGALARNQGAQRDHLVPALDARRQVRLGRCPFLCGEHAVEIARSLLWCQVQLAISGIRHFTTSLLCWSYVAMKRQPALTLRAPDRSISPLGPFDSAGP